MEKKDKKTADRFIKEIKRKTHRTFSWELKIRISLSRNKTISHFIRNESALLWTGDTLDINTNLYVKINTEYTAHHCGWNSKIQEKRIL